MSEIMDCEDGAIPDLGPLTPIRPEIEAEYQAAVKAFRDLLCDGSAAAIMEGYVLYRTQGPESLVVLPLGYKTLDVLVAAHLKLLEGERPDTGDGSATTFKALLAGFDLSVVVAEAAKE